MANPTRALTALATFTLGVAVVGCSSGAGGDNGDVASVNGDKISSASFNKKLDASPQAKSILSQMIQSKLIDQYATDNKIDIPQAAVDKSEDDIKAKYPPGQFDQVLKQQNLTQSDVQTILKEKLVVDKAIEGNVKVTDAQIADYISKNHTTLDTPMQVRAKHILVPNVQLADKIEQLLKGGTSFTALAKEYSVDPSSKDKGGELGFFSKGQMVPSFQAAAFSQPVGVVGPPVKSPFGYHIIVVEEKKAATVATVANSGPKVKTQLLQAAEQTQLPQFLANLRSKAKIEIYPDALKDALPPASAAGAAAGGAPATPAPAQ